MPCDVIVIGGGFAGATAAHELARHGRDDVRVSLLARENYRLFTPMLPEVATGTLDERHVVQPFRGTNTSVQYLLGDATVVDRGAREVTYRHPVLQRDLRVRYDQLVLATGAESSTLGIDGVAKYTLPFNSLADAARVRRRVLAAFEAASATSDRVERDRYLRFVIAGGGFTGVEVAGELTGYVRALSRRYPGLDGASPEVVIVEASDGLLSELPPEFGRRAAASLSRRGTIVVLEEPLDAADARGLTAKSGKRYETATAIWAAGVKPSPFVGSLGLATSKHGAVVASGDFSIPGTEDLWAAGDCAQIPKPHGGHYEPLAQNAVREGPLLAKNLLARLRGKPTKAFSYRRLGMMTSLGDRDGVAQLPGGMMIAGLPAWMLWRGYYLSRLPGVSRKLGVAADWMNTAVFGRSLARFAFVTDEREERKHAVSG